ncbi:SCO2322 family protein [Streptomyces sp. H27-D2]|uniref:SCO2322 family protein n=1 Tax=Streptomyces sp. H27-D2 TaxID=3046304 RepID=UPI002DBB80C5|nr:SCO2322 family protein [Streptomyces sp. H27-D2]MEC4017759.1 SCO2322 family protein [Streptomyces sp. H27-D2]
MTVVVLALAIAAPVLVATPAQADDGYRYWSFWDRDGDSWSYATQGPSTARPSDGDVQGFRFAVSEDSRDATEPRGAADFDAICADTAARDGRKRVALVIDFGTAADAPDGERPPAPRTECARVPEDASVGDALAATAKPLRYDSAALLCSITGYPETGCGEQVAGSGSGSGGGESTPPSAGPGASASGSAAASDGSDSGDSGPSAGLIGGIAAVCLLAAAAVWQARRRRA